MLVEQDGQRCGVFICWVRSFTHHRGGGRVKSLLTASFQWVRGLPLRVEFSPGGKKDYETTNCIRRL